MTIITALVVTVVGYIAIKKLEGKKEEEWTLEQKLFVAGMDRTNMKKKYHF